MKAKINIAKQIKSKEKEMATYNPLLTKSNANKREHRLYQSQLEQKVLSFIQNKKNGTLVVATGGGKTSIANQSIIKLLNESDGVVIWLTKDWNLLFQAVCDISGNKIEQFRIGGKTDVLRDLKEFNFKKPIANKAVLYSTLHTFKNIDFSLLKKINLKCVFVDEAHWGVNAPMFKEIEFEIKKLNVPIIGLTATPRESNYTCIGKPVTFNRLLNEGYLAKPYVFVENTNIRWDPKLTKSNMINKLSIKALANNQTRNEFILQKYFNENWGKTLLFAINIDHAKFLNDSINKKKPGTSEIIHSNGISKKKIESILNEYRKPDSKIKVLINVAMATTGFDVPDIQTIFLARPTESEILFRQMIGRGSRKTSTKRHFNIVSFRDNIINNADAIIGHAKIFKDNEAKVIVNSCSSIKTKDGYETINYDYLNSLSKKDHIQLEKELHTWENDTLKEFYKFTFGASRVPKKEVILKRLLKLRVKTFVKVAIKYIIPGHEHDNHVPIAGLF